MEQNKLLSVSVAALFLLTTIAGCLGNEEEEKSSPESESSNNEVSSNNKVSSNKSDDQSNIESN